MQPHQQLRVPHAIYTHTHILAYHKTEMNQLGKSFLVRRRRLALPSKYFRHFAILNPNLNQVWRTGVMGVFENS